MLLAWIVFFRCFSFATPQSNCRVIFVTSERSKGDLGGLMGAHDKCARAALSTGALPHIASKRGFRAWISTADHNAIDTFAFGARECFEDAHGNRIADSPLELAGGLQSAIRFDETGVDWFFDLMNFKQRVWTGTANNGTFFKFDCHGWTSTAPNNNDGIRGTIGRVDARGNWSYVDSDPCYREYRLFCISIGPDASSATATTTPKRFSSTPITTITATTTAPTVHADGTTSDSGVVATASTWSSLSSAAATHLASALTPSTAPAAPPTSTDVANATPSDASNDAWLLPVVLVAAIVVVVATALALAVLWRRRAATAEEPEVPTAATGNAAHYGALPSTEMTAYGDTTFYELE